MNVVYVLSRNGEPSVVFSSSRRAVIHIMSAKLEGVSSYYMDDRFKRYPLTMADNQQWREIELKLKHGHLGIHGFLNGETFTLEQAQYNPDVPISGETVY